MADSEVVANTHDRVVTLTTGLAYGQMPAPASLVDIRAQVNSNGSALSAISTKVDALRAAVDALTIPQVDATALAAALLANEEFAAVLAAAAFAGSQRAETE